MNYSTEAEAALLGALLKDGEINENNSEVIGNIKPEYFALNHHQTIAKAIAELRDKNQSFDLFNTANHLDSHKLLDNAFAELATMINNVATTRNSANYLKVVKDKFTMRQIESQLNAALEILHTQGDDTTKIKETLSVLSAVDCGVDETEFLNARDLSEIFINKLESRCQSGSALAGLSLGFDKLDELTGGVEEGDYIGICAKPSGGKTVSAMNVIIRALRRGESVLFFSGEMPAEKLMDRIYCDIAGVNLKQIRAGDMDDDEWHRVSIAMQEIQNFKLTVVDKSRPHISTVESMTRVHALKFGKPDWVVTDYWELIQCEGQNKVTQMETSSSRLKALAMDVKTRVINLAQLKKEAAGDPNPTMIKWSAQLEQDADILIFIHTDSDEYKPHPDIVTKWIVNKVRQGETGMMPTSSKMQYQRFIEFTGEYIEPERKKKQVGYNANNLFGGS
jgi:replicative DNA helicase